MHKLLFDDLGVKYLTNLTKSIIEKVLGYPRDLKLEDTSIREWAQCFLDQFDNALLCPV